MFKKTIVWKINITDVDIVLSEVYINKNDNDYKDFRNSMVDLLEDNDYLLYEKEHESNRDGSISEYFDFVRCTDDLEITVEVHIRVSDHLMPDKEINGVIMTGKQRTLQYLQQTWIPKMKKSFPTTVKNPHINFLDIVIEGVHYVSYDDALMRINHLVNCDLKRYDK